MKYGLILALALVAASGAAMAQDIGNPYGMITDPSRYEAYRKGAMDGSHGMPGLSSYGIGDPRGEAYHRGSMDGYYQAQHERDMEEYERSLLESQPRPDDKR
jgi:hypothetical protein